MHKAHELMTGLDRLKEIPPSPIGRLYKASAGLKDILNLAPGEPDFDTPHHILAALNKALEDGETHYSSSLGLKELRKAVALHYKDFFNVEVDEDQVLITHGSNQGIFLALNSLLDPGDEVIMFTPSWFGYKPVVQYSQGVAVEVPLKRDDWSVDFERFKKAISEKTKMILLCSPNNPTGSILRPEDLAKIAAIASEHELTIIADEIYNRLVYEEKDFRGVGAFEEIRDRLLIANGFSKTYAMTGIRLGYLIAPERIITELGRIQGFSNVCISPAVQKAGLAALTGPQDCVGTMVSTYDRRRRWLTKELNSTEGLSCNLPAGAFYVFPRIELTSISSEEFSDALLREQHVLTVPGSAFGVGGEQYLRISYATSDDVLKQALDRMREMLSNLHRT